MIFPLAAMNSIAVLWKRHKKSILRILAVCLRIPSEVLILRTTNIYEVGA